MSASITPTPSLSPDPYTLMPVASPTPPAGGGGGGGSASGGSSPEEAGMASAVMALSPLAAPSVYKPEFEFLQREGLTQLQIAATLEFVAQQIFPLIQTSKEGFMAKLWRSEEMLSCEVIANATGIFLLSKRPIRELKEGELLGKNKMVTEALRFCCGEVCAHVTFQEGPLSHRKQVQLQIEVMAIKAFYGVAGIMQRYALVSREEGDKIVEMHTVEPAYEHDLFSVMSVRSFSEEELVGITHQMIRSVAAVHRLGFIHRDIKPENFLFREREGAIDVVLTDLGAVTAIGVAPQCIEGTPGFTEPLIEEKGTGYFAREYALGILTSQDLDEVGLRRKEQILYELNQLSLLIVRATGPHNDVWALGATIEDIWKPRQAEGEAMSSTHFALTDNLILPMKRRRKMRGSEDLSHYMDPSAIITMEKVVEVFDELFS